MADMSLSPEIIKLMDKIAQNPNSRLFVPLAEEYLNNDLRDEAIHVLNDGIERHPTYVAARIMLGKIYLEENHVAEAKSEFERVIEINPENILAHKKLAVIYQKEGEPQRAVDAYRQILTVDPSDKESKILLSALEKETPSPIAQEAPGADSAGERTFEIEKSPSMATSEEVFVGNEDGFSTSSDTGPDTVESLSVDPTSLETETFVPETVPEPDNEGPAEEWQPEPIPQEDEGQIEAPLEISSPGMDPLPEPDEQETPATNSLGALYIDQGCYQEAADMYKECLDRNPKDPESREGLEKALRMLSEASRETGPAPDTTERAGEQTTRKGQTDRLQLWLNAIQKKKKEN